MKECPVCHRCFADDFSHCPKDGDALAQTLAGEPVLDGRYQLEARLGSGGMGIVFKARHIFLKTSHAIKVVLPDLVGNDPSLATRFRQEAMAAAAIRHPNIIAVTDFGITRGTMPFLVMEFIQGKSLQDLLGEKNRLSLAQTVEIIAAVGAGVGAAHRQGIVHRDLKPLNIMLQDGLPTNEAVKVLDFGLAKIKSGEVLGSFVQAQTTGLMGSPYYMAPEQWSDEEPDRRADIYSLGIIIFQMLTGDVPFKGSSMPSIMKKHLTSPPPSLASLGANVPAAVEQVIAQTLEKSPGARPQTVEDLIAALRQASGSAAPKSSPLDPLATNVMFPAQPTREPRHTVVNAPPTESPNRGDTRAINVRGDGQVFGSETSAPASGQLAATDYGSAPPDTPPQNFNATNRQERGALAHTAGKLAPPPAALDTQQHRATAYDSSVVVPPAPASNRAAIWLASICGALILLGGLGFVVYRLAFPTTPAMTNETGRVAVQQTPIAAATAPPVVKVPPPEMIAIPGGTFQMGTNDVAANSRVTFDVVQWPAHTVSVKDFLLQKTEVTNMAYLEFVRATGHAPPEDWVRGEPPSGQELWPVRNVSHEDARAYAAWRSEQDGVRYRLPTEEEWEYAARNGGRTKLYPWGDEWVDGRANVDAGSPKIVNSYPQGANQWGVVDLIGNVSEWTASEASVYPSRTERSVREEERGHLVQRGGSYLSKAHGERAITALRRGWNPAAMKNPSYGFRLAGDAP